MIGGGSEVRAHERVILYLVVRVSRLTEGKMESEGPGKG